MKGKFKPRDLVKWTDPSGEVEPDIYEVQQQNTEDDDGLSIYLITNRYSEAEVYEKELELVISKS